jgi:mxaJ protein
MRAVAVAVVLLAGLAFANPPKRELRVCADPNNLPLSNSAEQGFENRLAQLIARSLGAELRYTWVSQRRGVLRHALKMNRCDLVMGVPAGDDLMKTTRPYYRSSYVLVLSPLAPRVRSLDAPELEVLSIGVPQVGEPNGDPPPVLALAQRDLMSNVRAIPFTGRITEESPTAKLVRAVATGEVDVALVWGPMAGYLSHRSLPALEVVSLPEDEAPRGQTFRFDVSVGVSRDAPELLVEVERALEANRREISILLDAYGVPRFTIEEAVSAR